MRLTLTLCRLHLRHIRLTRWKKKAYVKATPAFKHPYVKDELIADLTQPPPSPRTWEPPRPEASQYTQSHSIKDHPDYHNDGDFVYEYHNRSRLMEGLDQACILTKTKAMFHLPKSVYDKIGLLEIPEQDLLVQRYIMQANVWDPTKDKLPRRINKRLPGWRFKAEFGIPERRNRVILLHNLVRLCQMIGGQCPDTMFSRSLLPDPYLSTTVMFEGDKPIMIRGLYEYLLTCERPLEPFASQEEVDETAAHVLPNLYPIAPVINLTKQPLFREGENIAGFRSGFKFCHPHTLVMEGTKRFAPHEINARMLMFAFGQCAAIAKDRYGENVQSPEEPITTQVVLTNGSDFFFGCFQLNTLNLRNSSGIKNLVWFDNDDNAMYKKVLPERAMLRNTRYEDYDPEVFRKFLALYLNGADLERSRAKAKVEAL